MSSDDWEHLLNYYKKELAYLREMGREFALKHPKLAGRLELSPHECADPHVERLMEAFAFLTARIQRRLDAEFPEITASLLGVLYPHLVEPIPPLSIAQFEPDPAQGKLTTRKEIPKGTALFAQTHERDGATCRFRTCYPVTLWPLLLTQAGFEPNSFAKLVSKVATVLRLRLTASEPIQDLGLRKLRFYLHGSSTLVDNLYELLFRHVYRVVIRTEKGANPVFLPEDCIRSVGFEADEEVIPYPAHAHPAYRLLQEFFFFPEKFHFFDIQYLDLCRPGRSLEILFLLDEAPREKLPIYEDTFLLGCTPVVNLFRRTSEPIRLDHRSLEYRLVPDMRRERTTEIHSIQSVSVSSNAEEAALRIEPFYSFRHHANGNEPQSFWHARRRSTGRADLPGTDVYLSFLDLGLNPQQPAVQTVFAHTLCTNRDLAHQVNAGALLQTEEVLPLRMIRCLSRPTPTAYPPSEGATLWALISNLSLNKLSLEGGEESLAALKEILRLYGFPHRASTRHQIDGIRELHCRNVVRRVGSEAWRGFCYGTQVTLVIDESLYHGGGAFLLGAVLHRFFALYTAVNSFIELVIRKQDQEAEWKRWPPLAGYQPVF